MAKLNLPSAAKIIGAVLVLIFFAIVFSKFFTNSSVTCNPPLLNCSTQDGDYCGSGNICYDIHTNIVKNYQFNQDFNINDDLLFIFKIGILFILSFVILRYVLNMTDAGLNRKTMITVLIIAVLGWLLWDYVLSKFLSADTWEGITASFTKTSSQAIMSIFGLK